MSQSPLFLPHHRVIVAVFTMKGCPACEEYAPRFRRVSGEIGLPAFDLGHGKHPPADALARTCLPIYIVDCDDKQFGEWAERLKVSATPSTYVLRKPRGLIRVEGSVSDAEVRQILGKAVQGLRCDIND